MSSWPSRRSLTKASWPGIGTGGGGGDVSTHPIRPAHTVATGPTERNPGVIGPPSGLFREIHLRRLRRPRRLQLEVRTRPLPQNLRRQHLREAPDVGVVAVHGLVVVLARDRDAILRSLELVLQRAEVLVGLELRVILGDGEQAAERR